jgi:hypothetical protein
MAGCPAGKVERRLVMIGVRLPEEGAVSAQYFRRRFSAICFSANCWPTFSRTSLKKSGSLNSQEFVIGGYTLPEGGRKYFGSLLVGYNSPDGLVFAGRVGTGFSEKLLASIDAQL